MPNPPTERDWELVVAMVRAALERIAAESESEPESESESA